MCDSDAPLPGSFPLPDATRARVRRPAENGRVPRRSEFARFVRDWSKQQGLRTPEFHTKLADWLGLKWKQFEKGPRRLLLLAFRGAGKSTLVGLFAAYMIHKRPDVRILALSADLALARKMVRTVKRLIEAHPETQGLKPKNPELWSGEQFTVVRETVLRDPSMLARGIDGNFTGSRADVIICDDVEVPGNSDTPAKRHALREKLGEIEFVLVPGGMQLSAPAFRAVLKDMITGFLDHKRTVSNIKLFAKEVYPRIKHLAGTAEIRAMKAAAAE